jgi:hypothetical protein
MRLNLNVVVFALAALMMFLGYEELAMLRSYARRQILKPSGVDRSYLYRGASLGGGDGDSGGGGDGGTRARKVGSVSEEESDEDDAAGGDDDVVPSPGDEGADGDKGDEGDGASAWTPRAARALRAFAREPPPPAFFSAGASSSWTKRPPRERCPEGACGPKGVCVADTGECRCSLGWAGDACERPDPQPCNDPSFPNLHFTSRCAGVCDISANNCVCGGGGFNVRPLTCVPYLRRLN